MNRNDYEASNLLIPGLIGASSSQNAIADELNSLSLNHDDVLPASSSINLDSLLSIQADNVRSNLRGGGSNSNIGNYHRFNQQSTQLAPLAPPSSNVHYRKVRPEPINERSLVGSVVGFIQDVVSGGSDSQSSGQGAVKRGVANNTSVGQGLGPMGGMANEVKEQIEWLHFENVNMLDSFENTHLANSNIILMLGYKTGFAVWSIDVSINA